MERISKTPRKKLLESDKVAWQLFPHLVEEGVDKMMKSAMKGKVVRRDDIPFCLRDGTSGFTSEVFLPLKTAQGKIRGVVGVIRETTERKLTEDRLKASLKEKEVLLREIHHRVKNNMQIMSSLLRLQISSIPDEETKAMCMESQTRIRSMALIHEKLYKSQDFSSINFAEYIKDLAAHLFHSYNIKPGVIKLTMDIEDILMDINTAIPCGLLFNELFSNSLKHAFPATGKGQINVGLNREKQGMCSLIIKDDGIGFPQSYDFENPATLGLQLVSDLVKQIDGSIQLDRKAGTTFCVTFTLGQK
jgi:two-component sensor histidine kinase